MASRNEPTDTLDVFAEGSSGHGRALTTEDLKRALDNALQHAKSVSLEEVLQSWEDRNPLQAKEREFEFFCSGPLNTQRNGLLCQPKEEHLDMWRRSATSRGADYDHLAEPMSRQGEAVKRAGSINHAYILEMKLLQAKNSYPVPLKLHMTGLRGRHYTPVSGKASRALYSLAADTHNESFSNAKARVIHKIPIHENIADAFALDNVSVETLDSEVTKLKTHPGWLIVAGGLASHTCRILADSNNVEPLRQIDFDPDATWVQDLQHVGKVTVIPEKAFLMCRNALARVKAEKERNIPSTDLTHFGAEFVVASKLPGISMQNIEQHENFINKSPAEVKTILDDGMRECRVLLAVKYVLKDDVLESALNKKAE